MKNKTVNLTEGSLAKNILLFSFPLMLTNLLQVLFNMSDIAVVGRFAGSRALGSVGSTSTLVTLFTGFLMGIGAGINVLVAKSLGAKDSEKSEILIRTAAVVSVTIGLILSIIGLCVSAPLLRLLDTKTELIDGAILYLNIYFTGMPAVAVYNFGNAVLSAGGDTKTPLWILAVAGLINIVLNLLFVIVFKMSVAGVALASIISQYASAITIAVILIKQKCTYSLKLNDFKIDWIQAKEICVMGIPAGLQNSIFSVANLFVQSGVNSFDVTIVEGNSAAANSDALVYDVMNAFYVACSSFMGQNYGAGKQDRVLRSYLISLVFSYIAGAILGGALLLFGDFFLSLFTKDAAVINAGKIRLSVMGCSYALSAFMDASIAACRGIGKSLVPTIIVILGSCVFRIIWIYTVFAYFGTIESLYLLYMFSWAITAIAEILYFVFSYKKIIKRQKLLN